MEMTYPGLPSQSPNMMVMKDVWFHLYAFAKVFGVISELASVRKDENWCLLLSKRLAGVGMLELQPLSYSAFAAVTAGALIS